jgi:hypothetical protein
MTIIGWIFFGLIVGGIGGRVLGTSIRIISRGRPGRLRDGHNRLYYFARALSDVCDPIGSVAR